jgi:hypothetical protein
MNIYFKIKGIREVNIFLTKLPKSMDKEIMGVSNIFIKSTQKSAKLRAPRWTGQLASSIEVTQNKNRIILVVNSPYGYFQEYGFRPHYVQLGTSTRSGFVIADWAASVGLSKNWNGSIFVSHYKPFIIPALEYNLSNLPNMLLQGTKNAIQNAGR